MNDDIAINNHPLSARQAEFIAAMERYENKPIYRIIGRVTSVINVSLQALMLFMVAPITIGPIMQAVSLVTAFIAADFINGLVHMYMDNNDTYTSFTGPLIAAFHLHHKTPRYKTDSLVRIYFNETGSKVWLVPFLAASAVLTGFFEINTVAAYMLTYTGIFSSIAEVTHYRCHVPDTSLGKIFGSYGIFLSRKHHARHHMEDNINYAFLNGVTDPLLNLIAGKVCPGYKNTTDLHYNTYSGKGTDNR